MKFLKDSKYKENEFLIGEEYPDTESYFEADGGYWIFNNSEELKLWEQIRKGGYQEGHEHSRKQGHEEGKASEAF